MPPKAKTSAKPKDKTLAKVPRAKTPPRAVTTLSVPTAEAPQWAPDQKFEWGGESYTAHMPKDMIYVELSAAWAPGATGMTKARAISRFVAACVPPEDRDRIEERMITSSRIDPACGMELLTAIGGLMEFWRPYMGEMFKTANLRANAMG